MNAAVENVRDSAAPALQQVLTFTLGDESFGVEILRVQEMTPEHLKPTPDLGNVSTDYIRALAAVGERMVMLLDVDRLLVTDAQRSYSLN